MWEKVVGVDAEEEAVAHVTLFHWLHELRSFGNQKVCISPRSRPRDFE